MFTGIVVDRGTVRRVRGRGVVTLQIESPEIARDLKLGESVAVNGVCLTATSTGRRRFEVEVMGETLDRSTIGNLKKGSDVNLELAMRLNERLGGHLVQGHVDGVATVTRIEDDDGARRVWFAAPDELLGYMVAKGSVTLDGVSLTIVEVGRSTFQVALIPHTLEVTTLGRLEVGTKVNVEVDILAKYVERLMARS
jgi:riboflavin synthase